VAALARTADRALGPPRGMSAETRSWLEGYYAADRALLREIAGV